MALRLPGSIMTPFQFWDFLLAKKDARSLVPDTRYNISAYHTGLGKPGEVKSEYGYFLDDSVDIGALDTTFFNMAKTEMERLDPQQRQLLEVVRECFESAGEVNYQGKNIGCFVGTFGEDWAESSAKDQQTYGLYRISRYGDLFQSNRISFDSDLRGPSMTIRTGCSSSLIGLHEACGAIARGDCTSAIVGGANMILGPSLTQAMTEQGVLSPDGSCKSFDAEANGYARAEAINAVYVKPLEDALRDGNPIRAVIRGTSSNSDGKTIGISQPSAASHEDMMRKAYSLAGIETLSDTAYIECHGTGTAIGDPIETSAVANVFGEQGVYIGSVKPNVGHSEGASGLTSLIKAVLSLENRTIPPNIKFNKPNPRIAFGARKIGVPVDPVRWPEDRCERAGVNSFGIGGANAHVVLESKNFYLGSAPLVSKAAPQPRILVYSANTPDSLRRQVERPECLHDLSYTLGARREHLVHRAYSVAGVSAEPNSAPKLGAQWPQTRRELFHTTEKYLSTLPDAPSWRISDELCKSSKESNLHKASYSQPLCTAVQVALVDALTVLGVVPAAVVGHSSGEMAAAYAAGRLTAREAIIAAYYRGVVSGQVTRDGGMAAIGLGWDETSEHLVDGVVIACENSPSSVTISGDADRVKEVLSSIQKAHPNALARPLKVDKAYHSHHMKEVGSTYRQLAKGHALGTSTGTKVDFFSSVTGQLLDDARLLDAAYWQANLESPVLFRTAIANLVAHARLESKDNLMILEVGPHSALAGPLRQILARESAGSPYASCMTRGQDCTTSFLSAMGELYLQNITLDFEALTNPDATAHWRFPKFPKHELLGVRVAESTSTEPAWRNVLILDHVPWIRDHNIKGDVVYPCAAYVAMAGEAVRQLNEEQFGGYSLRNVIVSTAMVLNDTKSMEIMTSLKRHRLTDTLDSAWWEFTISSYNGSAWIKHCSEEVCSQNGRGSGSSFERPRRMSRKVSPAKWYESSRHVGANYGPLFPGLKEISTSTTDNLASARAVVTTTGRTDVYSVHPTQIDAFLQLLGIAAAKGVNRSFKHLAVPTYAEQIDVCSTPADFDITTSAKYNLNGSILGDGYGLGTNGSLALRMKGVKLSPLEGEESLEMLPFFELTALCIEETLDRVSQVPSRLPHLEEFPLVAEVSETAAAPVAEAMLKVMENAQAVFNGTTEPLEFLMADQTLTQLYNYMDGGCDRSAFMQALGHSNPKLRILEIGAGTGGTTATILSDLQSRDGGNLMYSNYTYTDISAGFFSAAKDRFKSWPNIEFATLDISQDPEAQGLKTASYDLVLATNVLHATPNLHETLANVRKLIRPDGRLLLQELSAACKADEPYVSPQRWEDELREAGFDGLDAVVFDAREPLQINALMMAKPIEAAPISPRDITVLCDHSSQSLAQNLKSELVSAGRHVVVCGLEDTIPDNRDIVALLDLEQPFFANIREAKSDQFRALVSHLKGQGVLWATRTSQMMCKNPRFAQSLGAARVIRNEFSLDVATCEIDHPDDSLAPFMAVLSKFQSRREDESFQPEQEYAIVNGEVYVPRKMIGAEIYATVGSDNKVEFLIDNYEIPRDHIFHSRDTSFRDDVLRMTEGAGVDIVLNSLSGELLHASWDCVAEFGTLLEIGKRDFIGNGRLAMNPFELNRNYCGIDLGHLLERKPASVFRLLNKIVKYYEQGYIQPIKPIKTFQASAVEECFRYMQKGQHIGKIVVSMTATSKQEHLLPSESQTDVTFDSDASYLLVGGLGGLGRAVSTWMVERGARHLIYLSRSAGKSAEDQDFIHELQEQDCVATAVQGNAANEDDVAKAVQSATKLKGILQMSMLLRDCQLSRMTFREWNAVVMPKVQGTWNLHNLTIGKKLDFFVMFSSISGIMGQHGQSNYSSANTFLDAFVQYRHSKDMAASSRDIGVMEDAGYVAENPAMLEGMRAAGFHTIRESELLEALIMAISAGRSCATEMSDKSYTNNGQFVLGLRSSKPLSDSANRVLWRRDRRAAVYHNESSVEGAMAASTTSNKLREFLALCTVNPEIPHDKTNVTFLAQQVGLRLYDMVMKPVEDETTIDISLSVQDLGLDSLVAIEMKTWWKHTFGFDISVLEMLGMGSVLALGEHAAQGLLDKYEKADDGRNDFVMSTKRP
ncbi:KR domain-containing protein [Exophiala viscosa]|uniref:KR domain-containing protein n=1 Tax=Exophiala viscosa TaxID=2486360 RepID=A0AAN6IDH0_9EURO|nr:KR domain-containing protein [Exophiala viscosa]